MHIKSGCYENTLVALIVGVVIGVLLMQIPHISFVARLTETTESICDNMIDDDSDMLIDCADGDCALNPACNPPVENICNNFVDDDSDGDTDCEDSDCSSDPDCAPVETACDNMFDDDGDSYVDCDDGDCEFEPPCV